MLSAATSMRELRHLGALAVLLARVRVASCGEVPPGADDMDRHAARWACE
jgi:hypothetical protein